ncbi:MmgE/PrpD family protein [Chelativorans alearense]|uniref:MmgE/PrpD family protein n=1 Tax=Chelativorans alearense TaxID=2681495 RepID=UPI0013D899DC|nr:MmgE/PrpD family protein [Chelativorans alearense]
MDTPIADTIRDSAQGRLTDYAMNLCYENLPADAVHAAKVRLIDTLGVLIGGYSGEPCKVARRIAKRTPQDEGGATVIGSQLRTAPDLAAFANGTAARYLDMNDTYNWPNSAHGHPSDVIAPVLAAGEAVGAGGVRLIEAIVLAYEIFLRTSHMFQSHRIFDTANLTCIAGAVGAGKLLGLSRDEMAQCIAMAVVPNAILKQVRLGKRSMYKAAASGHGARAGVFAALLARAGMGGPDLPFEGDAGWCEHVARGSFERILYGGEQGTPFKICDSLIKLRPANAGSIAAILAAETIAPLADASAVRRIVVEVSFYTKRAVGSGEGPWHPDTREIADHSIPYLVAHTLVHGTVGINSFENHFLHDPRTRVLVKMTEVDENPEYTRAYDNIPVRELARVTVTTANGDTLVGESGGAGDGLSAPKSDDQIANKFLGLTAPYIGEENGRAALNMLWNAETMSGLAPLVSRLVIRK